MLAHEVYLCNFSKSLVCRSRYAAPPPTEPLPEKFPKKIDGYNVEDIYHIFVRNIERSYADALIQRSSFVESYKGPRIIFYDDWGRNSTLIQFDGHCDGECIWSHHALTLDGEFFREIAIEMFNPHQIVDELKLANISPDLTWDYPFQVENKIKQKLVEKVDIKSISQSECPAILKSLKVLEGLRLPKIDIDCVGKDKKGSLIITHQFWIEIELPRLERNTGVKGEFRISGYGPRSYAGQLANEVMDPMRACAVGQK